MQVETVHERNVLTPLCTIFNNDNCVEKHLQILEFGQVGEDFFWQISDFVFTQFQPSQAGKVDECSLFYSPNTVVIQISAMRNKHIELRIFTMSIKSVIFKKQNKRRNLRAQKLRRRKT